MKPDRGDMPCWDWPMPGLDEAAGAWGVMVRCIGCAVEGAVLVEGGAE
jgi:hypothetical protein